MYLLWLLAVGDFELDASKNEASWTGEIVIRILQSHFNFFYYPFVRTEIGHKCPFRPSRGFLAQALVMVFY